MSFTWYYGTYKKYSPVQIYGCVLLANGIGLRGNTSVMSYLALGNVSICQPSYGFLIEKEDWRSDRCPQVNRV